MRNKRLLLLYTLIFILGYLDSSGQADTTKSKLVEHSYKYQDRDRQSPQLIHLNKNLGVITSAGLTINSTEYSLLIQAIDETSLQAIPQKEVDESIEYVMPNKLLEIGQPFDTHAPQTQALLKNLKSKNSSNRNE